MEEDFRSKTFWGIIWSYVNRFGTQFIAIVPTMILARLIPPSEYGLLAMTAVFTGVASMLADGGFGNALVQKKNADHLDLCSVFYFNLVICGIIYIVFWFLAPLFASLFCEIRLVWIIRITSINIIFGAIGQIHGIIFIKNIEYKKPAVRNIFVQLVSAILAICMAFGGYGVWALVVQGLSQTLLGSMVNWFISIWRPTLCFSFLRIKLLFAFGSKILLRSVIDYVFEKLFDVIIGKYYSSSSLAYYNRGVSTVSLFNGTFWGIFGGVVFPVFSKMQDDTIKLVNSVRKFVGSASLVFFSAIMTILVLAEPLFKMMYSSRWDAAIPLFQLLCISSLNIPFLQITESILWAKGESGKVLVVVILYKVLFVIALFFTWRYGVAYMIIGKLFCETIELLFLSYYTRCIVGYGIVDLVRDIWKNILIAIVLSLFVLVCDRILWNIFVLIPNEFIASSLRFVFGVIISMISFVFINKRLGLDSYKDLISLFIYNVGNIKLLKYVTPK